MHPVKLLEMLQRFELYVLNRKCYAWGKLTQHITEYHRSCFQAWWILHHVMGMLVIGKD
jgi:hypothetical protein